MYSAILDQAKICSSMMYVQVFRDSFNVRQKPSACPDQVILIHIGHYIHAAMVLCDRWLFSQSAASPKYSHLDRDGASIL